MGSPRSCALLASDSPRMFQQFVEKSCLQAGQKDLRGEAREKSTSGSVLRRYVEATPLGAGMIPAAIERNYPKRLLKAGWWHMSLFQQPASSMC